MINEQIYIKLKKILNHFILNRGSGSSKAAINGVNNIPNALLLVDGNNGYYRDFVEEKGKIVNMAALDTAWSKAVVVDNGFIMKLFEEITKDELYFESISALRNRIGEATYMREPSTDIWWLDKYEKGVIMFRIQSNVSSYTNYVMTKMIRINNKELPYFVDILSNEVFDFRRTTVQHNIDFMFLPSKTEKFTRIEKEIDIKI